MITPNFLDHLHPFWLVASILELSLFMVFIRSVRLRPRPLWLSMAGYLAVYLLWWGIHLAHLDIVFDLSLNIVLLTLYLIFTRQTESGQSLYLTCVYVLCTEIGKIVALNFCMEPFQGQMIGLTALPLTLLWVALCLIFTALSLLIVSRWVFGKATGHLSWGQCLFILLPLIPYTYIRSSSFSYDAADYNLYTNLVLIQLLLCGCTIVIIIANAYNLSAQIKRNELLHIRSLLREQHAQYEAYRAAVSAINRRYHDLKHYINELGCVEQPQRPGGKSDTGIFIDTVKKEMRSLESGIDTGNEVLDVLLASKKNNCLSKGIRATFFADGRGLVFMNSFDLCAVIGNALDNAIEAAEALTDDSMKEIDLMITYNNNLAVIQCRNNYTGDILRDENGLISTKASMDERGFGLKSIREIVERYNGNLTWSAVDGEFTLTLLIPVPLSHAQPHPPVPGHLCS